MPHPIFMSLPYRLPAALAAFLLFGVFAGAAWAQVESSPPDSQAAKAAQAEAKARREFQLLDANGDGKLSRAEVRLFPRLAAAFDDADTDGDNFVSFEEVRVFAAKHRAERERKKAAASAAAPASAPAKAASSAPAIAPR